MPKGELEGTSRVVRYEYDFDKDGGAVGEIPLRGPVMTANQIIFEGLIDVEAEVTSGGAATAAIHAKAADDIYAAAAVTGLTIGLHDVVPVDSAATAIKLTANGGMTLTVAVAALTAGKFVVKARCIAP